MKFKQYKQTPAYVCIDPGARIDGGTGLAVMNIGNPVPKITRQFSGLTGQSWEENQTAICNQLIDFFNHFAETYNLHPNTDVWIEQPQFMESFKGTTAAKSGSLFKLCTMYGRIFQVVYSCKLFPRGLEINKWKGQLSKKQVKTRVEQTAGCTFKDDDTLDAIGMGHYLNRSYYGS